MGYSIHVIAVVNFYAWIVEHKPIRSWKFTEVLMKLKCIPIWVGAISLITCLTGAIALSVTPNSAVAQESTSRPTPPPPGLRGIDLTQQQQEQIKQIWSELQPQFKAALPTPPQLTEEQKAKLQQVVQPFREKLEAVLSAQQRQQLQQQMNNPTDMPAPPFGATLPPPSAIASLNLTAQQQEQIKQISQEMRSQIQAVLPAPAELTAQQKANLQQLEQSYREKVEAILQPEQQQQFRQNLEQFHQRKPGNSPQSP